LRAPETPSRRPGDGSARDSPTPWAVGSDPTWATVPLPTALSVTTLVTSAAGPLPPGSSARDLGSDHPAVAPAPRRSRRSSSGPPRRPVGRAQAGRSQGRTEAPVATGPSTDRLSGSGHRRAGATGEPPDPHDAGTGLRSTT
jgi:hypothetical protein